jgi:hypothetical protein
MWSTLSNITLDEVVQICFTVNADYVPALYPDSFQLERRQNYVEHYLGMRGFQQIVSGLLTKKLQWLANDRWNGRFSFSDSLWGVREGEYKSGYGIYNDACGSKILVKIQGYFRDFDDYLINGAYDKEVSALVCCAYSLDESRKEQLSPFTAKIFEGDDIISELAGVPVKREF